MHWGMGDKVPGNFWAQVATKTAPNIAGNLGANMLGSIITALPQ